MKCKIERVEIKSDMNLTYEEVFLRTKQSLRAYLVSFLKQKNLSKALFTHVSPPGDELRG